MNTSQAKKYCLLIKDKEQNKLSLHILHQEKLLKNKKTIEEQGRKQIDDITTQNEGVAALTNRDDHNDNY